MEESRLLSLGTPRRSHSILLLVLICLSWITLLGLIVETIVLAALDLEIDVIPEPAVNYTMFTLTPPRWTTLTLVVFTYLYQLVWLAYATANVFRYCPTANHRIYATAGSPSAAVFTSLVVSCLLIIVIDILANHIVASVLNLAIVIILHIGLGICHHDHSKHFLSFLLEGLFVDLILARVLVQNGVATLLTWRLLQFYSDLADSLPLDSSYEWALGVVCVHLLIWFILDMTKWKGYVQFTFSPYLVLLLYVIGLTTRYDLEPFGGRLTLAVLVTTVLFLSIKTALMSWRYRNTCTRQQGE